MSCLRHSRESARPARATDAGVASAASLPSLKEFPRILIYYMDRPDAVEVIRVWDAARGLEALLIENER